jgi:hypothetical protein
MKNSNYKIMTLGEDDAEKDYRKLLPIETNTFGLNKISPDNEFPVEIFRKHYYQTDLLNMYVLMAKQMKSMGNYGLSNLFANNSVDFKEYKSIYRSDKTDLINHLI